MEIGLCWAMIHRASLIETIEIAARHGFPTLEVSPGAYFASLEEGHTKAALRRRLADAGVRVQVIDAITGGLPGLPEGDTQFRGQSVPRDTAETCLAVAQALEAPVINVSHYRGTHVPLPVMAEAIGAICRKAAAQDVTIVLEFVPESGIPDVHEALAIAQACGEPNCRLMLDTWHLARGGGTLADVESLPSGSIGAMQLSDRIEPAPGTPYVPASGRKLPGEGELPLARLIAAALANNPGITIELEVFSEDLLSLPPEQAAARTAAAVDAWKQTL